MTNRLQRGPLAVLLGFYSILAPLGAQNPSSTDSVSGGIEVDVRYIQLPELPVYGSFWRTSSQVQVKVPARPLGWTPSELLSAGMDVRAAAPGGSAWLSLDGLPATHTAVQWQGLALQAADLGVMDVRLLPSSGLVMERSADGLRLMPDSRGHVNLQASSLGNGGISFWMPGRRADYGLSASSAANRYAYRDFLGERALRLGADVHRVEAHSAWRSTMSGLKHDGSAYVVGLQQGLPEAATQPRRPGALQQDLRAAVVQRQTMQWGPIFWQTVQHATWATQRYIYDQFGGIYDTNTARTVGIRVRSSYTRRHHEISTSIDSDHISAYGPNKHQASVLRVQAMMRGGGTLGRRRVRYQWGLGHLRQGTESGRILPLLELRAPESAKTQWLFKAHGHQRMPTLNDLFWVPGGNADLRPERGWELRGQIRCTQWSGEFYGGRLRDAIVWMPVGALWTPRNIASLIRAGGRVQVAWEHKNWQGAFRVQGVHSVNGEGFRTPYVAPWTVAAPVSCRIGPWEFRTEAWLRGTTPTAWSRDPALLLPTQFQVDAALRREFPSSHLEIQLFNLTNSPVLLQLGYPLPGRYLGAAWTIPLTLKSLKS